jgi:hypothetical protein
LGGVVGDYDAIMGQGDAGYQDVDIVYRGTGLAGLGIESGGVVCRFLVEGEDAIFAAEFEKGLELAVCIPMQQAAEDLVVTHDTEFDYPMVVGVFDKMLGNSGVAAEESGQDVGVNQGRFHRPSST